MGTKLLLGLLVTTAVFQFHVYGQYEDAIQASIEHVKYFLDKQRTFERNIISHNTTISLHSSGCKVYLDSYPNEKTIEKAYNATVVLLASQQIAFKIFRGLPAVETARTLSNLSLSKTDIGAACIAEQSLDCDKSSKYRSIDGSCNNVHNRNLGRSSTAYRRIVDASYSNGVNTMARTKTTKSLPNARLISTTFSNGSTQLDKSRTLAVPIWGQFVANDLSQTVPKQMSTGDKIYCCEKNGKNLLPRYQHPSCASITIPDNDNVYSPKNVRCMNYVRSQNAIPLNCSLGPTQQINQATHYLDASTIYGSDEIRAQELRTLNGGLLKFNERNNRTYLPNAEGYGATECEGICYKSGDARANDQPQLTSIHTIWLREHNRIAKKLNALHPEWSDEILYQEARRLVIAEIQHITYNEWLPEIVSKNMIAFANSLNYSRHSSPEVYNEVPTAALRFVNSLLQQEINLVDEEGKVANALRLSENFYNPRVIQSNNSLDQLLRGLATQLSGRMDLEFVSDLTSRYYANKDELGVDIFSLDIQRGRDHGLQNYNEYRKWCKLPIIKNYDEFNTKVPEDVLEKLTTLYPEPSNIDLIVGLFAEGYESEDIIGYTLECILGHQFVWTRIGDRYFYNNPDQPHPFTREELNELNKVTLARVICDNSDGVEYIQPNVFRKPDSENKIVHCSKIPKPSII